MDINYLLIGKIKNESSFIKTFFEGKGIDVNVKWYEKYDIDGPLRDAMLDSKYKKIADKYGIYHIYAENSTKNYVRFRCYLARFADNFNEYGPFIFIDMCNNLHMMNFKISLSEGDFTQDIRYDKTMVDDIKDAVLFYKYVTIKNAILIDDNIKYELVKDPYSKFILANTGGDIVVVAPGEYYV